ncbi:Pyridoxal reductase, chloroplastic [Dichanthelium oligosanthes]|uniref:Pyridoxal reductase, chloroplastic n=1 Tax=Dichanthelium oligosanthes TaxID=888268 RepID=A0A1E5VY39_9POAL|nr:Pyridoxal reductase, chloroplastic [Dichanthelium oligosanthes]
MALPPAAGAPAPAPAMMPFAARSRGPGGGKLRRPSPPQTALRLGPLFWPWEKVKVGPLSVSPMGFGTWAWGNQLLWGYQESMDSELQECFNLALRSGINLFDTADSYGTGRLNGQSERLLGKFIRDFEGPIKSRDDVVIATKFAAYPWRLTSGQFVGACKYSPNLNYKATIEHNMSISLRVYVTHEMPIFRSSLERLQLDRLAIGQLHWSTANYAPLQERALWDGLVEMYEKGLVRAVGVSNYGPKQLLKIHSYLASKGVPLSSAQVQFSLLSMGDEQMELKTVCDSLGIRLIAYSPLGLGMLTGKYDASNLPKGPRSVLFRQILPGLDSLLSCLRRIAEKKGKTMSQVAINWCICKGTIPIPGVKTVRHVEENLGALGWRLSPAEISELESAAMAAPKKMIQNVFQTA